MFQTKNQIVKTKFISNDFRFWVTSPKPAMNVQAPEIMEVIKMLKSMQWWPTSQSKKVNVLLISCTPKRLKIINQFLIIFCKDVLNHLVVLSLSIANNLSVFILRPNCNRLRRRNNGMIRSNKIFIIWRRIWDGLRFKMAIRLLIINWKRKNLWDWRLRPSLLLLQFLKSINPTNCRIVFSKLLNKLPKKIYFVLNFS